MSEPRNTELSAQARAIDPPGKPRSLAALGVLGALLASSCCILPLVLVSFGVTGVFIAQLGAVYQYKWITFALSAAFIGYGFYKAYRPIPAKVCADGTCARPMNRTLMRSILWIATAIVAVAMIFPYLTPYLLSY